MRGYFCISLVCSWLCVSSVPLRLLNTEYSERKGTLDMYNQEHASEIQEEPCYKKDTKKKTSKT
jgi:hypothetical protein